ncbi:hypothetical protein [Limimaricola pyoseonensis]|uniref:Uncharacterized protein n=1 Tax=Limimaricola pyoseonensis TaxID=521013 RepID=A0A1G7G074_9RHOB|nr:hypothetical protein [Limimaricola pyoseonensis]SDE81547.1 hypothetical protein SAMN04488567_2656 [Limimaricola pyoseonensis]
MIAQDPLHTRLEEIAQKLDVAEHRLDDRAKWLHGNVLTKEELLARYKVVKRRLKRDIADLEARGHHVGPLEASLREWWLSLTLSTR